MLGWLRARKKEKDRKKQEEEKEKYFRKIKAQVFKNIIELTEGFENEYSGMEIEFPIECGLEEIAEITKTARGMADPIIEARRKLKKEDEEKRAAEIEEAKKDEELYSFFKKIDGIAKPKMNGKGYFYDKITDEDFKIAKTEEGEHLKGFVLEGKAYKIKAIENSSPFEI
ncbi:MAG: hypothetical protein N4A47_04365 [Clostridia bacterium]|jgi:hypothetical protein|nr:hypothetical protein [Clostridia bacterium]